MTAIAERISKELTQLPEQDQEADLCEVIERLDDLRAKKINDAVKSGEMQTFKSSGIISDLRQKYGL